ncbi:MAG: hypothetical protein ACRCU6_03010 [Fusobacteriaceae bacterium]
MMNFNDLLSAAIKKQKITSSQDVVSSYVLELSDLFSKYLPSESLRVSAITSEYTGNTTFVVYFKKGKYLATFSIYKFYDSDRKEFTQISPNFCFFSDSRGVKKVIENRDYLYYAIRDILIPSLAYQICNPEG